MGQRFHPRSPPPSPPLRFEEGGWEEERGRGAEEHWRTKKTFIFFKKRSGFFNKSFWGSHTDKPKKMNPKWQPPLIYCDGKVKERAFFPGPSPLIFFAFMRSFIFSQQLSPPPPSLLLPPIGIALVSSSSCPNVILVSSLGHTFLPSPPPPKGAAPEKRGRKKRETENLCSATKA